MLKGGCHAVASTPKAEEPQGRTKGSHPRYRAGIRLDDLT